MRNVSQLVTQFTLTDPNYPDGKFINDAVPGDNTGSELVESWPNELLGAMYAVIRAAGLAPNGNAEYPGQSQFLDAIRLLSLPVGSLIAWQDFGSLSLPFGFLYNDGQTVSDVDSPINGQVLQDMSNRTVVGFGTEGGADIGTAGWTTGAVGNPSHQINIQHSHTVASHNHTGGNLQFQVAYINPTVLGFFQQNGSVYSAGANFSGGTGWRLFFLPGSASYEFWTRENFTSGTTGNASPGTNNQLSATQSIQMRSIRVRFITKIK